MPLREITEPVNLCLPNGRLNPEAVGRTRTTLHRGPLSGRGHTKRWEYWGITTPNLFVGLTISSLRERPPPPFVDGVQHYIDEELAWHYDLAEQAQSRLVATSCGSHRLRR